MSKQTYCPGCGTFFKSYLSHVKKNQACYKAYLRELEAHQESSRLQGAIQEEAASISNGPLLDAREGTERSRLLSPTRRSSGPLLDEQDDDTSPLDHDDFDTEVEVSEDLETFAQTRIHVMPTNDDQGPSEPAVWSTGVADHHEFNMTNVAEVLLLHILSQFDAPLGTYDKILEWARFLEDNKINAGTLRCRSNVLGRICDQFGLASLKPVVKTTNILRLKDPTNTPREFEGASSTFETNKQSGEYIETDVYYRDTIPAEVVQAPVSVIVFEIEALIKNMLNDKSLMQPQHFVGGKLTGEMYMPEDGRLGEINSGSWYRDTYTARVTDPTKQLMCPIIIFMDGTQLDFRSRNSLTPVSFTFTFFKEECRRDPKFWALLGFLPNVKAKKSSAEKEREASVCKAHAKENERTVPIHLHTINQHICWEVMFSGLKKLQDHPITTNVCFNGLANDQIHQRQLLLPIALIMGDIQGNDYVCARRVSHLNSTKDISRVCNCPGNKSDDHKFPCQFKTVSEVKRACDERDEVVLTQMQQHLLKNAFYKLDFGASPFGVHGQTPCDILHMVLEGTLKKLIQEVIGSVGEADRQILDQIFIKLNSQARCSARKQYNRVHYSRGVTNMTGFTAKELAGICLFMALCLCTSAGDTLCNQSYTKTRYETRYRNQKEKERKKKIKLGGSKTAKNPAAKAVSLNVEKDTGTNKSNKKVGDQDAVADVGEVEDDDSDDDDDGVVKKQSVQVAALSPEAAKSRVRNFIHCLEQVACFEAWTQKKTFWRINDKEGYKRAHDAIKSFMHTITTEAPRLSGNGWQNEKFHDSLHLPHNILTFGGPRGYDAGIGEKNHKPFAKKPASRTQKQLGKLEPQTATRFYESYKVQRAATVMQQQLLFPEKFLSDSQKEIAKYMGYERLHEEAKGDYQGHERSSRFVLCRETVGEGGTPALEEIVVPQNDSPLEPPEEGTLWLCNKATGEKLPDAQWNHRALNKLLYYHYFHITKQRQNLENNAMVLSRSNVRFVSEYVCCRGPGKVRRSYRAHPHYQSSGPWFDWTWVNWKDNEDSEEMSEAPCQIRLFVVFEDRETGEEKYEAVVWSGHVPRPHSVLTRYFTMEMDPKNEPQYRILSCDYLGRQAFCFLDFKLDDALERSLKGGKSKRKQALVYIDNKKVHGAFVVLPRDQWADAFLVDDPEKKRKAGTAISADPKKQRR